MAEWYDPFGILSAPVHPAASTGNEYVLPDAKLVGGRMVPVTDLPSTSDQATVDTFGPEQAASLESQIGFNPPPTQQQLAQQAAIAALYAGGPAAGQAAYLTILPPPATASQAAQVSAQAQATEAARAGGIGPAVMDPVWLRSDCNCRGGQFVEVPGQPQNSFCLPPVVPTGKMFDVASRGCLPIPGYRGPVVSAYQRNCYYGRYNLCLIGGIALGALLLLWAFKGKKTKSEKSIAPAITGPGAGI
jgi:hypothetical protein